MYTQKISEYPVEKHNNKPPKLVEPPQFDSRYLHIQRKDDMRIIRAMNVAQRPQNKSPSNMELDSSSPETIPNASDNDQEGNKSLSSSITSTDDSHKTERSRLQKLTPPRTRVIDECNIETHADVNKKHTLTDADGDIREHTWESNSDNSKCELALQNQEVVPTPPLHLERGISEPQRQLQFRTIWRLRMQRQDFPSPTWQGLSTYLLTSNSLHRWSPNRIQQLDLLLFPNAQGLLHSISAHIRISGYYFCAIEVLLFDAQVFQLWERQPRQYENIHGRSK